MNQLITTLFDNRNLLSEIIFHSFDGYNQSDINQMDPTDLEELAGNLIIDFNDQFDSDNPNHNSFWDTYLEPINQLLK